MTQSKSTQPRRPSVSTSIKGILASVAIGALVAAAGGVGGYEIGSFKVIHLAALLAFGVNWLAFLPANAAKTEKYYDLTGSLTYLTVIWLSSVLVGRFDSRTVLLLVLISVWTVRLGWFLFGRISRDGHDRRFDRIKTDAPRFLMMWTTQGLWVFLTLAAALAAITAPDETSLGAWAAVGAAIWVVGFAIEATADHQKSVFRSDPKNKGRYITNGLWAWSRHPNYFGEIMLWAGIAVIAVPTLSGWRWVTLISPVFVYLLLTRVSGVPMLEKGADKRWGDEPEYQAWKAATPELVPRPPRTTQP